MADKLITKVPENYEWEVHNLNAYADKKKALAEGKITELQLREFEYKYRESEEQREQRWRREHVMREMDIQNAQNYREFKENPKSFLTKMADMGRAVSEWWVRKPKKPVGKGRMWQSSITGQWFQEHKPDNKSQSVRQWLNAANNGQAFKGKKGFNPDTLKLDKPTPDMIFKSNEAKRERQQQKTRLLFEQTNNFGRGWHTTDRSMPGRGSGQAKQVQVTFSDKRVTAGGNKKTTKKK